MSEIGSVVIEYNKPKTDTRKHMLGTNHLRKIYKSSVNTVQSAGTIIANPGRVMWVKVYKETFEGLLDELHRLTNRLLELMDDYRIRKIQGYTARTCLDMIQVRNDVSQLKALFGAVTTWILQPITTGRPRPGHYLDMKALVELKLRSLPVEQILLGGMGHGMATEIFEKKGDIHGFQRDEKDDVVMPRTRATLDRGDGKPVWVEWKSYDLTAEDTVPDETKRRTAALAELLSIPKPADFCTPQCLGFLDGRTWNLGYSYGWVFELPVDTAEDVGPVSLFELLEKGGKAPSISSRVKMAEKLASCVLYMHTVSWLHKGIRSDNVLFLPSSISVCQITPSYCLLSFLMPTVFVSWLSVSIYHLQVYLNLYFHRPTKVSVVHADLTNQINQASPSLSTPTLSGFEYARPESSSTTKRSDPSLKWDIYRWPSIQRAEPTERNSRKTYDVYSLGLVLLEIAHWKPLYEILGLGRWPNVSLKDSKAVRERVLQEGCVGEAGGVMGGRYEGVVRRCVEGFGEGGLGVREGGDVDETSPGVAVRLQGWFIEGVVEELKGIDV